jgi:hypothetical protein
MVLMILSPAYRAVSNLNYLWNLIDSIGFVIFATLNSDGVSIAPLIKLGHTALIIRCHGPMNRTVCKCNAEVGHPQAARVPYKKRNRNWSTVSLFKEPRIQTRSTDCYRNTDSRRDTCAHALLCHARYTAACRSACEPVHSLHCTFLVITSYKMPSSTL